jgi:multicomponent Na+:H+ antiporter subunit C
MEIILSALIGCLFAGGVYCLMRRSLMRLVIGVMLLSQGANLLVFSSGTLTADTPAFVTTPAMVPPAGHADPLPQALVLTAIVIGFGLMVFTIALLLRAYQELQSDDSNDFNRTDQIS